MKENCFKLFMLLCLSLSALTLQAQNTPEQARRERFEKIQNYKISYLTGKLDLSPEQAQKFWPLYNQYNSERHKLRHQVRIHEDKLTNTSEQDIRELLHTRLTAQQNMVDLDKAYMDRFLKVITAKQVALLYRSEDEFPRILLEKLHAERHPNN